MKISTTKSRIVSVFAVVALAGTVMVGAPTAAQAAPQCLTASFVTRCAGVGADGAPYSFVAAANFNGTVFLYSHGVRPPIDIPATLAPVGPYTMTNAAEPGPLASSGDLSVINKLVAAGYGVAGSGFSRQGINTTEALAANKELIATFKTKFPTTKNVIAWGASLGAMHSQMLAEKNPELVDGVILACPAANPQDALMTYFGDALWGFKALFDPSIKVGGYSTDPDVRKKEQHDNVGKILTVLSKLSAGLVSGAWPDTASPAGKALAVAGIPSRSALLAVGLMAGVPTRSKHVDGTSGPVGATDTYSSQMVNYLPVERSLIIQRPITQHVLQQKLTSSHLHSAETLQWRQSFARLVQLHARQRIQQLLRRFQVWLVYQERSQSQPLSSNLNQTSSFQLQSSSGTSIPTLSNLLLRR
jgi:hypothetical protein